MPWDPNRVPEEGDISPQTLVFNYLKSKGLPLNADNVRRTIEANARDPGVLGADPVAGLRNTSAGGDNQGVGKGSGSVAGKIEGGGKGGSGNNTPVDSSNPNAMPGERSSGSRTTSAGPGEDDATSGFSLPGALGAAVLGGGLYGLSRLRGGGTPNPVVGEGARAPTGDPNFQLVGDPYTTSAAPEGTMESAMQKALTGPGPELQLAGPSTPLQLGGSSTPLQLNGPTAPQQLGGPGAASQLGAPPDRLGLPAPAPAPAIPMPDATSGAPIQMGQPPAVGLPGVQPPAPSMVSGMPTGASTPDPAMLNEANIRGSLVPPPQIPLRPRVPGSIIPPNIQELIQGAGRTLRGARAP